MIACPTCGHVDTRFVSMRELAAMFADDGARNVSAAAMRARGRRIAEIHGLRLIETPHGLFVSSVDVDRLAGIAVAS